jgi:deoxyribose-phosphate aldolase
MDNLNRFIDYTLLKSDASFDDIEKLCLNAIKYDFKCVVVNSCYVKFAKNLLNGSSVGVCCVVGFPLGANNSQVKVFETKLAVNDGADEIDMVLNIGYLKSFRYNLIEKEIKDIVHVAKGMPIKVIIETSLLTDDEKIQASKIAEKAGAKYIKTSTGFQKGATLEDVQLIKNNISNNTNIKASGGISNLKKAIMFISNGADRIGTSSGVKLMKELKERDK